MSERRVSNALKQVQLIQQLFVEKNRFCGYSGSARIFSGFLALFYTIYLANSKFLNAPLEHLIGWIIIATISFCISMCAVSIWYFNIPKTERNLNLLSPVRTIMPLFFVAAILTFGLVLKHQYDLLFGMWMIMFGLIHFYATNAIPLNLHRYLTLFYIFSGVYCLIDPNITFLNPYPMGLVFFFGEIVGGIVFIMNRKNEIQQHQFIKEGEAT